MSNRKNNLKKLISLMLIVVLFLTNITYANDENDLGRYRVYSYEYSNRYIKYDNRPQRIHEYYYIDNLSIEHPAYCMNFGLSGAEEKEGGYDVDAFNKENDPKVVSIILNGFPYKSAQELGLENDSQARVATQFAIWIYKNSNLDINKISAMEPQYQCVVDAIHNIYNMGISQNSILDTNVNFEKENEQAIVDNIDKSYYSQTYSISHSSNVQKIDITVNGSNNYKITDINNNEITDFIQYQKIKILIPRKDVENNLNIDVKLNIQYKQTAILFGTTTVEGMQNMDLILSPVNTKEIISKFDVKYTPCIIKIKKVDYDDNTIVIPNVKFRIYSNSTNKILGEYITDKNGEIVIDSQKDLKLLSQDKIRIEEIEVPDEYYIDYNNNSKIINIEYGKTNEVVFKNKKIKGKIEITKTSLDYNDFLKLDKDSYLEGVKFNIYDDKNNLVDSIITDKNGKAVTKDLLKGSYYIKEIKTNKYFELDDSSIKVNISNNDEIVKVNIKNKSKQKELPKTGY